MANEAFALSPIAARPVQPSEEDYAAISEAFMETSRGRWFLAEFAKRNRNADTRLVLDAVARLEESFAAQKQAAAVVEDNRLQEALAAIRGAVEAAQASASEALDGLALGQKLAPVRKGARVIREISWRLREIGNDGRICDLIDSQLSAIEAGAAQITSDEAKAALTAAFASIADCLAQFAEAEVAAPAAAEAAVALWPEPQAVAETMDAAPVQETIEADVVPAVPETAGPEIAFVEPAPQTAEPEAPIAEPEATGITDQAAADAHDEAVLDLIAMEMGAPDPSEIDDDVMMIAEEMRHKAQAPVEPEMTVAQAPEPVAAVVAAPPAEHAPQLAPEPPPPAPELQPVQAMEVSLGSTIIASGIVKKPRAAANDPLAPIRRMSQAEKIALFS
jgi:hypothetical protein